jgi:predicted  nucleic acid-binding Zn-ribbon protein
MSGNTLEQKLSDLRVRAGQARKEQAAAEARRQQAQGAVAAAQAAQAAEFPELAEPGMSPEKLLAQLEKEAGAEIRRVEAALAVAEGAG